MAIIKAISSKATINAAIEYVTKKEKTEKKLVSGYNCQPESVAEEMQLTKEAWGKTDGRTYKHIVQSFHPDEPITPEEAHKIAQEFAEKCPQFQGFEVLIATHKDKKHVHTHFIINSVSYEDGHKFQQSKQELKQLKELSDEILKEHGLKVVEKGKTYEGKDRKETSTYTKEAHNTQKKAESGEIKSYIREIALAVMEEKERAKNKEEFIANLKERGIGVDWQENHKYITFIDLDRQAKGEKQCKVRDNKLGSYYNMDFSKETLEDEFTRNLQRESERTEQLKRAAEQIQEINERPERLDSAPRPEVEAEGKRTTEPGAENVRLESGESKSEESRDFRTDQKAGRSRERNSGVGDFKQNLDESKSRVGTEISRAAKHLENAVSSIQRIGTSEQEDDLQREVDKEIEQQRRIAEEITKTITGVVNQQRELDRTQRGINQEQQHQRKTVSGTKERASDVRGKASRVGDDQQIFRGRAEDIRGKQRFFGNQQSSISGRIGEIGDRVLEFAERIKEVIKRKVIKVGGR